MNYLLNILTAGNNFDLLLTLGMTAVKATFLLGVAALLCRIFRRFSAATRHLVWVCVFCASLLLPFLSFVKGWEIPVLPAPINRVNEVIETPHTPVLPDQTGLLERRDTLLPEVRAKETAFRWINLPNGLLAIWGIGVFLLLLRVLVGNISIGWLASRAVEVESPVMLKLFSSTLRELNLKCRIRFLHSDYTLMPIVCGIWRPTVILPITAENWTAERSRIVLLHELKHIARQDCLTQLAVQLTCAFYWFNPLIWAAARRLRIERERACDDYVISLGTRPSDYASHLLEIARALQKKKHRSFFVWPQTNTVAMAQQSQLEERLRAILNTENKHGVPSRVMTAGLIMLTGALFLLLTIVHPTAIRAENSSVSFMGNGTNFKTDAPEQRAELNLFLEYGLQSPDKINNKLVEKKENNPATIEIAENQNVNYPQGEPVSSLDNSQAERQPSPEKNAAASEIGEPISSLVSISGNVAVSQIGKPISGLVSISGSAPRSFIKTQYESDVDRRMQEITDDFIEEMASVGYKNLSLDELIRLKNLRVTAEYVKSLRAIGFDNLTVKELLNLRAANVTQNFIVSIREMGFKDVTIKDISNLAGFGLTLEYIEKIQKAGYTRLSLSNLIDFKAFNITPELISTMNALGFGQLEPGDLIRLKAGNVTPEFIRLARSRLGNDLTLEQVISLKKSDILKE